MARPAREPDGPLGVDSYKCRKAVAIGGGVGSLSGPLEAASLPANGKTPEPTASHSPKNPRPLRTNATAGLQTPKDHKYFDQLLRILFLWSSGQGPGVCFGELWSAI